MKWTIRFNFKFTIFGLSTYDPKSLQKCAQLANKIGNIIFKRLSLRNAVIYGQICHSLKFEVVNDQQRWRRGAVKFSRQISYFQLLCRCRRQVCLREYPFFFFSRMMADPKQRELWKFSTFFKVTERTFCPTTPFVKLAWPSRRLSYLNFTHIVEMVL